MSAKLAALMVTKWDRDMALLSVLPISKLNKHFFGYFDPENIFLDNKNKYFWGELTDNSAKKEALTVVLNDWTQYCFANQQTIRKVAVSYTCP